MKALSTLESLDLVVQGLTLTARSNGNVDVISTASIPVAKPIQPLQITNRCPT